MRKKAISNIYHIQKYIQMQKANCIFKFHFNNDKITPQTKKLKKLDTIKTKSDIRIFFHRRIFKLCLDTVKVRKSMFIKYLEILVISKSQYLESKYLRSQVPKNSEVCINFILGTSLLVQCLEKRR